VPGQVERQSGYLAAVFPLSIKRADDGAGAGAGDQVDRDTLLLQHGQHPDMRQPTGGTTAQSQTYLLSHQSHSRQALSPQVLDVFVGLFFLSARFGKITV
jgi:hypothetical protein